MSATGAYVLDASMTFAWCFEDESDARSEALLDAAVRCRIRVPGLWALEVANVLVVAERKRRIDPARSSHFLALLQRLPIDTDGLTAAHASGRTMDLARHHGLSVYDAAYLELALREGLPLATRDGSLTRAAEALGVRVL